MVDILLGGLAAGALTVLLCSSQVGEKLTGWVRKCAPKWLLPAYDGLIGCSFCVSWWVSIAILDKFTIREWAATVAIANFTILLLHWSLTTEEDDVSVEKEETIRSDL